MRKFPTNGELCCFVFAGGQMPRPIEAVINRDAFRHNLANLRERAGGRFLWAVSKANSYGHGLAALVPSLSLADGIAVLDLDEAARAREAGWKKPILLIEGFFDAEDLEIVDALALEILVHSHWQLEELKKFAFRQPVRAHLKVNSGMNRLGFAPEETPLLVKEVAEAGLAFAGLVTHFANAEMDYPEDAICSVAQQLRNYAPLSNWPSCMANSAALLWHPEAEGEAVRAGIAMYGVSPSASVSSEELGLIPVMTLTSRILAIQNLGPGQSVGYGSRHVTAAPARIGVIACGYADGYPRQANENREVVVRGKKAPIVGSISMDMTTIDLTRLPEAREGDEVELWGCQLPVNEVAEKHGTIGYELLANLNERVRRRYVG